MTELERKAASGIMLALLLGSLLFSAIILVKGETETHDLGVSLVDTLKAHLSHGNSTIINATVVNNGNFREDNVTLLLLINDTVYQNSTAQRLSPNATFWSTYLWSPEDGVWNVTVYAPPASGESITTNNNASKLVNVCPDEPPIVRFDYSPKPPIMYELVTFDASNSKDPDWGNILNYTWNFGDGYTATGIYSTHNYRIWGPITVTLTLNDTEGESNSTSANMTVYARPVANFIINERPPYFVHKTLTFNATASYDPDNDTGLIRGIANYAWNFGDGNSSTTSSPTIPHTYETNGTYSVTLNVTDYDDGLTSSNYPMPVIVGSSGPIANFTPPPQPCYVLQSLTFDARASNDPDNINAPNKGIANYAWNFDDGNTTTVPYPMINHPYQTPGTYNVNLNVTDSDEGLTDSVNRTVTVSFEVFVKAVDSETGKKDIVHNPGQTFNVSITVTNVVDLYSYEVNLTWPGARYPILEVTSPDVQSGRWIGTSTTEDFESGYGNHQGYVWIRSSRLVVGGVSGNGTLATITFHVNDTMTGNCNLTISYSLLKNSTATPIPHTPNDGHFYTTKPVANFTYWPPYPSVNQPTYFNASTSYDPDNITAPNNGIASYAWDFGDGSITSTPNPIAPHNYTIEKVYTVALNVTDYDGNTWSLTRNVTVGYVHDVAIIDVEPIWYMFNETTEEYHTAGSLAIYVAVVNNGTALGETFSVTLYAMNATLTIEIGTITVLSLQPGVPQNLTFYLYAFLWNNKCKYGDPLWNATCGLPKGSYTISANVTWMEPGIESDINPSNNNCTCEYPVKVYLTGDYNGDGKVDMTDIGMIALAYGSQPGKKTWDPNADIVTNEIVDMDDLGHAALNFGQPRP